MRIVRWFSSAESKDLIATVLHSNATKRDAKGYLAKYKTESKSKNLSLNNQFEGANSITNLNTNLNLNLNSNANLNAILNANTNTSNAPHKVALIKLRTDPLITNGVYKAIGHTLKKLSFLGINPIVILDDNQNFKRINQSNITNQIEYKASTDVNNNAINLNKFHEISNIIQIGLDSVSSQTIDSVLEVDNDLNLNDNIYESDNKTDNNKIQKKKKYGIASCYNHDDDLLNIGVKRVLASLARNAVPIIFPTIINTQNARIQKISADYLILKLIKQLKSKVKISNNDSEDGKNNRFVPISIEKIIYIDPLGGIPSVERNLTAHFFINLAQEYSEIMSEISSMKIPEKNKLIHQNNITALKNALDLLPDFSTGMITTPRVAAGLSVSNLEEPKRLRNPVIYNLLTDRPTASPSLPVDNARTPRLETTVLRKGVPLLILSSPPPSDEGKVKGISLSDNPQINLQSLINLLENSFKRKLDVDNYLKRVNGNIAGIIIATDPLNSDEYSAALIITWEKVPETKNKPEHYIPYLDKIAVATSSQSSGAGLADILFKAMVIRMHPDEILWRSRKNNPVNKWYFERCKGSFKIKDTQWCMFWAGRKLSGSIEDYIYIIKNIPASFK